MNGGKPAPGRKRPGRCKGVAAPYLTFLDHDWQHCRGWTTATRRGHFRKGSENAKPEYISVHTAPHVNCFACLAVLIFALQGCGTLHAIIRPPRPWKARCRSPGLPDVRAWGDAPSESLQQSTRESLEQEKAANHGKLEPVIDTWSGPLRRRPGRRLRGRHPVRLERDPHPTAIQAGDRHQHR